MLRHVRDALRTIRRGEWQGGITTRVEEMCPDDDESRRFDVVVIIGPSDEVDRVRALPLT